MKSRKNGRLGICTTTKLCAAAASAGVLAEGEQDALGAEENRAERNAEQQGERAAVQQGVAKPGAVPRAVGLTGERVESEDESHAEHAGTHDPEPAERYGVQGVDADPTHHQHVDRPEQHRRQLGERHRSGERRQAADLATDRAGLLWEERGSP
jgi:hypothetical protein